jgi:hypothetical protein
MSLNLENLEEVRGLMLEEFETDLKEGKLYLSPRLKEEYIEIYIELFREAIKSGNDKSLAESILISNCLKSTEIRKTRSGKITETKVPRNAHETLAEGEFNRYYIRGICRKALSEGLQIEVYRAKQVKNPRPESQALIGKTLDPRKLLDDLRTNIGVDTALGVPAGPNSGLSVRLKR